MTRSLMRSLPMLLIAAPALAATPASAPQIEMTAVKFQSMLQRPSGQYDISDSTVVPHVIDYGCYLWELNFKPKSGTVELTEEVIIPTTASGPTTARMRLPVDLSTGKIRFRRCVGRDDPAGAYKLNLLEGEHLIKSIDFTVEDLKPQPSS